MVKDGLDIKIKLRDYQQDIIEKALRILKKKGLVYLAMQTRTGKTLTALSIYDKKQVKKGLLFVTKKKAIKSIEKDYDIFGFTYPICVINYESIHKIDFDYDFVILDESHCLGAFPKPSKRTKEVKQIIGDRMVMYLSATPTPESYSQLYHQLWVCNYSPFKNHAKFYTWAKEYVNIKKKYVFNREVNDYSDANKSMIDAKCKDIFITLTQSEAGINQQIEEKILTCNIRNETLDLIDNLKNDRVLYIDNQVVLADTEVKLMSKIHQLSSGTVKTEEGNSLIVDHSKAQYLREYFEDKRIVIFYKFKGELDILKLHFHAEYCTTPEDFQNGDSRVFLAQFISGREGIRLDTADAIVFYNIDFSFLSYEQAKNRIVSFERKESAILYWLFSNKGIESQIYKAVSNKKDYTISYFREGYGRKNYTKEDNTDSRKKRLLLFENNTDQQKRISGFDFDEKQQSHYD